MSILLLTRNIRTALCVTPTRLLLVVLLKNKTCHGTLQYVHVECILRTILTLVFWFTCTCVLYFAIIQRQVAAQHSALHACIWKMWTMLSWGGGGRLTPCPRDVLADIVTLGSGVNWYVNSGLHFSFYFAQGNSNSRVQVKGLLVMMANLFPSSKKLIYWSRSSYYYFSGDYFLNCRSCKLAQYKSPVWSCTCTCIVL